MILVSNSPSDSEWLLPTVTNNYEARLARRKRSLDEACEEKQELTKMHTRRSNKKTKVEGSLQDVLNASNASNACIDRAPHEVLAGAGDWIFEPLQVVEDNELVTGDTAPSHEAVDVGKVISILLAAISASRRRDESPEPPARSHRPHPTSPLSNSYYRTPFIRKSVGGPRRGRIEPGLRKWVMCKNHVEDVRSSQPSLRSSEWVEALHEMGWEYLHPTYILQSQQTIGSDGQAQKVCQRWASSGGSSSDDFTPALGCASRPFVQDWLTMLRADPMISFSRWDSLLEKFKQQGSDEMRIDVLASFGPQGIKKLFKLNPMEISIVFPYLRKAADEYGFVFM